MAVASISRIGPGADGSSKVFDEAGVPLFLRMCMRY